MLSINYLKHRNALKHSTIKESDSISNRSRVLEVMVEKGIAQTVLGR